MTQQMNLFDMVYQPYKITKPIRLIELFGGIGSQSKALERLGANFAHWKLCEWAIPSILAYKEIHQDYLPNYKKDFSKDLSKEQLIDFLYEKGISSNYNSPMNIDQIKRLGESKVRDIYNAIICENNLVNISSTKGEDLEIKDTDKYDYILCYSFPCQDLSNASGNPQGMAKDSGTRSGLLWQVERLLKECNELPQILLLENVSQIINNKNKNDLMQWEESLKSLGYNSYYEILNAADYGTPQNRKRFIMVSVLGNYKYNFPKKQLPELTLKDLIDEKIEDKYLISQDVFPYKYDDQHQCLLINQATKKGYDEAYEGDSVNISFPKSKTRRGRVGHKIAQTLLTGSEQAVVVRINEQLMIKRYSPKECYRLMSFDDIDYERARKVISDRWITHTAGDSICVNVLYSVFKNLM